MNDASAPQDPRRELQTLLASRLALIITRIAYSAHSTKQLVSATLVAHEMQTTRPLAVVMAEEVAALRAWAAGRTVSAD